MPRCTRDRRREDEAGVATVWAVTWMFTCLMVGWLALLVAGVVAAQHHLDAAADLSSLSAAARLQRGQDACATAASIARANQAAISGCRVEGADVVVTVGRVIALPFGVQGHLTSTARAGP